MWRTGQVNADHLNICHEKFNAAAERKLMMNDQEHAIYDVHGGGVRGGVGEVYRWISTGKLQIW